MRFNLILCTFVLAACLSACGKHPFPDDVTAAQEAETFEAFRSALYEGMPMDEMEDLIERRPLLEGSGPDYMELIYVFRVDPLQLGEETPESGSTYLRVRIDRASETIRTWQLD